MKYKQWHIARQVVTETEAALLRGEHEVFAIWAGAKHRDRDTPADAISVTRCIVPDQRPGQTGSGVFVHIEGEELQRIQLDNFSRGDRSIVQLHTHPGRNVEMSALDREWEVVRHVGALSIIVPFYGKGGLMLGTGANVYEREIDDWRLWSPQEASERLVMA